VSRALRKLGHLGERFDLIFLDPPYEKGLVDSSLKTIAQLGLLDAPGRVVVEHSAREAVKSHYGNLILHDQRRYGDTLLSFFKKGTESPSAA
jgi:16S rRNA G966 N2-methylase RsmD